MKHLLRDRLQENQSWLQRCKQWLSSQAFVKPEVSTDFVSGLSPETQLRLKRVQGSLKQEWLSAERFSLKSFQGKANNWVPSIPKSTAVSRPKVRVQMRRLNTNSEQPQEEVRGLDDIFPEKITGFFQEEKSRRKQKNTKVVVDYKLELPPQPKTMPAFFEAATRPKRAQKAIAEENHKCTPTEAQAPVTHTMAVGDEIIQDSRQGFWPVALLELLTIQLKAALPKPEPIFEMETCPKRTQKAIAEENHKGPPAKVQAPVTSAMALEDEIIQDSRQGSWSVALLKLLTTQLKEALPKPKPVFEVVCPPLPEFDPVKALPSVSRKRSQTLFKPKNELRLEVSVPAENLSLLESTCQSNMTAEVVKPEEIAVVEAAMAEGHLLEKVQASVSQWANGSQVEKSTQAKRNYSTLEARTRSNSTISKSRFQEAQSDTSTIAHMLRSNQILSRSIMNLADRYFQQAALEEV